MANQRTLSNEPGRIPRVRLIGDSDTARTHASPRNEPSADQELLDAYSRAVIHVVDMVGPAVVNIGVGRATPRGEQSGAGSGVVIAPDGYILTNSHVVHGASRLTIAITDGSTPAATVVG